MVANWHWQDNWIVYCNLFGIYFKVNAQFSSIHTEENDLFLNKMDYIFESICGREHWKHCMTETNIHSFVESSDISMEHSLSLLLDVFEYFVFL